MSKSKPYSMDQQETAKDNIKYFVTPVTTAEVESGKKISRYDSFDIHSKAYKRSSVRISTKTYTIK
jgi:hypothetical protein